MKKDSKTTRFLTLLLALLLSTMPFVSSVRAAAAKETPAKATAKPSKLAALRQGASEEAMTTRPPVEMRWRDVASKTGKPATTLQPGEEDEDEQGLKLSDIDPETLRRLKEQPYHAPPSMPNSYQTSVDASVKGTPSEPAPLAPNLVTSFESIDNSNQLDSFLHRPPDCSMAAGANHVIAAVNSMYVIYNKSGSIVGQASFASFYNSVCSGCSPFDPRVIYDPLAARWIMLVVNGGPSTPGISNYLVAASQTSDPTGSWWLYSLSSLLTYPGTGESTWADFPQIGFDGIASGSGGAVYITSNQFTFGSSPAFRTATLSILPKSSLYAGTALSYWRTFDKLNADSSQAFALSPALTYGNPGAEFMLNTENSGSSVSLWKVIPTFPPTAVNWTLQSTNNIGAYSIPPDASQPGGCALMATNDNRLSTNTVWRNNKMYAAFVEGHNWGGGGGTVAAIRTVQINTSTNATEQNFTYGSDGTHYFFPAVVTDSSDNLAVVFARSSSTEFGNIRFTGRLPSDTVNTYQTSALLKAGTLCITGNRWGDYFAAAVDPADTTKMWLYGTWAKDVASVAQPWDWGTYIGQVQFSGACTYSVAPPSANIAAAGGPGSFSVTTQAGCPWTATTTDTWLHTTSSGNGNGTVNYTVDNNTGSARAGTITVQGQTHTVNQAAGTSGGGSNKVYDFDGDGKADVAVWRPTSGTWFIINSSNGSVTTVNWGTTGDVTVPADYDGDGKADVAVWRPSTGVWYIINSSNGSITSVSWGVSGDKPVPADYDGDGKADIAVWRPSAGRWFIINSSNGSVTQPVWGSSGDVPTPARP
jgi:FG-GAP-like repeat